MPPTSLMERFSLGSVRLILMLVISPSGIRWYNLGKTKMDKDSVYLRHPPMAISNHFSSCQAFGSSQTKLFIILCTCFPSSCLWASISFSAWNVFHPRPKPNFSFKACMKWSLPIKLCPPPSSPILSQLSISHKAVFLRALSFLLLLLLLMAISYTHHWTLRSLFLRSVHRPLYTGDFVPCLLSKEEWMNSHYGMNHSLLTYLLRRKNRTNLFCSFWLFWRFPPGRPCLSVSLKSRLSPHPCCQGREVKRPNSQSGSARAQLVVSRGSSLICLHCWIQSQKEIQRSRLGFPNLTFSVRTLTLGSLSQVTLPPSPEPTHRRPFQAVQFDNHQFTSVQSLSRVWLFVTPWTAARQASLSITNSQSLLKIMSIESVMPSNHLNLCHPLLLPSIFPSIRVFSNESALCIRWPKYWNFSFNISPSNEHPRLISFRMDWLDLLAVQGILKSLLQHHSSKASILRHSASFKV